MKYFRYISLSSILSLSLLSMVSCSSDDELSSVSGSSEYAAVSIDLNVVSPSYGGAKTRSAETSGVPKTSTEGESRIDKCRLFVFDAETGKAVSHTDLRHLKRKFVEETADYGYYIYPSADTLHLKPGIYRLYAIANCGTDHTPATEEELLGYVDDTKYKEGYVQNSVGTVMTTRGDDAPVVEVVGPGVVKSVTVPVERVLAKVTVKKQSDTYMLKDADNNNIELTPNACGVFNLMSSYYLFRHVAEVEGTYSDTPSASQVKTTYGNIPDVNGYAYDPMFFQKTYAATTQNGGKGNNVAHLKRYLYDNSVNFTDMMGISGAGSTSTIYCLPNTQYKSAQTMAYTTGVMIKCRMKPSHVIDEDGGSISLEDCVQAFLYQNRFYSSLLAARYAGANVSGLTDDSNDIEQFRERGIRKYEKDGSDGLTCYYIYWIKHDPTGSDMKYGIVRNNIYDINIIGIEAIGSESQHHVSNANTLLVE